MSKVRGLLIPGTGATALRDTLGHNLGNPARPDTLWGLGSLAARSPQEAVDTLAMEHREGQLAPLRTSRQDGRSIVPAHAFSALYLNVPKDYAHFLYDWRCDVRYNAERFAFWLKTRTKDDERWHLVAHSQGVLVAILAAKLMNDEEEFSRYVASIRMVGPPISGTIASARWLVDGLAPAAERSVLDGLLDTVSNALPDRQGRDEPSNLQQAARTWPSVYQMLPVWNGVTGPDGQPLGEEMSFLQPEVWVGHEAIDPGLLRRARETRDALADPLSHMAGIDAVFVLTTHADTPVAIVHRDGLLTSEISANEPGDSLIPFDHTLAQHGDIVRRHAQAVPKSNELHDKLLSDDGVWAEVGQRADSGESG